MNKYIIYQGSGGLVHLLGGLVYCCDYIKNKRKYKLIVDIKNHKAFGNYLSKYFILKNVNYSENYDDIIDIKSYYRIPLSEFEKKNVSYIKEKGYVFDYNNLQINIGKSLHNIDFNNNIKIYAGHGGNCLSNIIKYVKCNKEIQNKLNQYKCYDKYVGVHFRNTDRSNDINNFLKEIKKYKEYKIYLATDDINALHIFKNELKDYNLFYYFEPFDANGENIHFNNPDKDNVIMSILIDMYMLYNSNIFIKSPNSLVSKLVNKMRVSNESIFV